MECFRHVSQGKSKSFGSDATSKALKTTWAASGSQEKLNSVDIVVLPCPLVVPPMIHTRLISEGMPGSSLIAIAKFVNGPIISNSTSFGFALIRSIKAKTACFS